MWALWTENRDKPYTGDTEMNEKFPSPEDEAWSYPLATCVTDHTSSPQAGYGKFT